MKERLDAVAKPHCVGWDLACEGLGLADEPREEHSPNRENDQSGESEYGPDGPDPGFEPPFEEVDHRIEDIGQDPGDGQREDH